MAVPVLEVSNLRTSFHTEEGMLCAVDGVSFTVEAGHTLGIVGESGCGKSVTSLSILKLLPRRTARIEQGSSVKLKGEELTTKSNRAMCDIRGNKIAMIFQDSMTSLNPVLTIEKQMVETFLTHQKIKKDEARRRSVEMLRKVGIPSPELRIGQYPHQLSGGMRQRVMIAMALSCSPDLLIADEPTTALDVTVQAQILELMQQLKQDFNTAILLITHDMGIVAGMADHILVMYSGYVMEYADTKSLFSRPLHPYTEGLLQSIPRLDQRVEELHVIQGVVPSLLHLPPYCVFAERCPYAGKICFRKRPDLFKAGDAQVRCFRHSAEWDGPV
ncbi:ABC transporter ATP-binding protein [Spirochaetia bacterium]|nr:ABC transporter ATP-binding protein [Spirochaetia bacterium]